MERIDRYMKSRFQRTQDGNLNGVCFLIRDKMASHNTFQNKQTKTKNGEKNGGKKKQEKKVEKRKLVS